MFQCGNHSQDIDKVETCANGQEGSNLLVEYGKTTEALKPPLKSVPTVVVNNVRILSVFSSNSIDEISRQKVVSPTKTELPGILFECVLGMS